MQTGPPFPPPNAGVSSKSATWNQNIPAPGFGPADDEIFFLFETTVGGVQVASQTDAGTSCN